MMTNIFSWFVIFTLSLSNNLLAQELSNLDQKYGVNKFKLEDPFSKYKDGCHYESTDRENVKEFKYTLGDVKSIFNDIAIESILLYFYKDRLMKIHLILGNTSSQNEEYILKELTRLFDTPNRQYRSDQYTDFSYAWVTEKTELIFVKFKSTNSVGPQTVIDVLAYKLYMESQNDRF